MVERPRFHLSIPAIDLQRSHDLYVLTLGCRPGCRSDQAAILDFEGHQWVLQSTPRLEELPQPNQDVLFSMERTPAMRSLPA